MKKPSDSCMIVSRHSQVFFALIILIHNPQLKSNISWVERLKDWTLMRDRVAVSPGMTIDMVAPSVLTLPFATTSSPR